MHSIPHCGHGRRLPRRARVLLAATLLLLAPIGHAKEGDAKAILKSLADYVSAQK